MIMTTGCHIGKSLRVVTVRPPKEEPLMVSMLVERVWRRFGPRP
jgi:Fe2+ transport system protein FeoA